MRSLALALGVTVVLAVTACSGGATTVEPLPPSSLTLDPIAAAATLTVLASAVATDDPARAGALGADDVTSSQLRAVVNNAAELSVTDFSLRYVSERAGADASGRWDATVEATWRFGGVDPRVSHAEIAVGFLNTGTDVLITGFALPSARAPYWLAGPVVVRRGPHSLVLAPTASSAVRLRAMAERGWRQVHEVLPQWQGPAVIEAPDSVATVHAALDSAYDPAAGGAYSSVAGVTTTTDGVLTTNSPVHVFLNPVVFDRLGAVGAQVVITHELVHVATDGPLSTNPTWLLEGFADYVALRSVGLPLTKTAGQIAQVVRRDGPPAALPTDAEFDPDAAEIGATYEAAWLLCTVIADHAGEQALVRLYDAVDAGRDLNDALEEIVGWTPAQLLVAWQERLVGLPGA